MVLLMDLPMDKLNQLDYLKAFKLLHKVLKGQGLPRWLNWPAWLQQQLQQLQPQQKLHEQRPKPLHQLVIARKTSTA